VTVACLQEVEMTTSQSSRTILVPVDDTNVSWVCVADFADHHLLEPRVLTTLIKAGLGASTGLGDRQLVQTR